MAASDPRPHPRPSGTQSIDRSIIDDLKELGGDWSFVVDLIDIYVDDSKQRVSSLAGAIERGDIDAVEKLAHALKSASANVGAKQLAETCKDVETRARARSPITEVAPIVKRIEELHDAALEELRSIRGAVES
jgi:HPt (histidine-containing phosphotransfer) domain-containing protein